MSNVPDFANRFSIKHDLLRVESTLRNNLDHHMPPAAELDASDAQALNEILRRIRDLVDSFDARIPY